MTGRERPQQFHRRGNQVIEAVGLQHADDAQAIRTIPSSLLVSERRRQISNQRDRYRAAVKA